MYILFTAVLRPFNHRVNDSTVKSITPVPCAKEANDESPAFCDKGKIGDPITVPDIEDLDERPQWVRMRYTGSATPSLEYSSSSRLPERRSTSPIPLYRTSARKTISQASIGATYVELLPGKISVGTLSLPPEYPLDGTLSRRMTPIIVDASTDTEQDPNDLPCHGDFSAPADDDLEPMDCNHPGPELPGVSADSECLVGISGRKHTRSRLSRMLDDDYSSDEDFHEPSSEDERLPALSEAIPIPLRELGTHTVHQDHHEEDNPIDSDSDDVYVEGTRNAHTITGSAFNQSSLPRRHPINTSTTTRKRSDAILSQQGRKTTYQASTQVPPNSLSLSAAITTNLPKSAHGKARRILAPRDDNLPLVTISMRADINYIDHSKPY